MRVQRTHMRRINCFAVILVCIISMFFLPACDSQSGSDESGAGTEGQSSEEENQEKDPYDEYIRSALQTVNQNGKTSDDVTPTNAPTSIPDIPTVTPVITPAEDFAVSSMESPDDYDDVFTTPTPYPTETAEASPSPTEDPNATPTPTPTPYITPDEFDVGKCCIYINGESDSAFGTEVITAINKARTDLGYKPLITNKGLGTCADRRTREIAANFDHTRPNGLQFYSLAPEHFKAEMLLMTMQKAEDTVDAMIKNDPVSRRLIFTEKYQSIGASSFKCNGTRFTVVSFGL